VLQTTICVGCPNVTTCWAHVKPPNCGKGLLQSRCCVSEPPPHVAEHAVTFLQEEYPPFPRESKYV